MLTDKTLIIGIEKKITACHMSLTFMKNKRSPKIEPWGTLQETDSLRKNIS